MPIYRCTVSATSNSSGNTDDTFIELLAASGSAVHILDIEIFPEDAANDDRALVKLVRQSAAGATGTSGTAIKEDRAKRATSATATVKNGSTAFSVGTITDTAWLGSVNGRAYLMKSFVDEKNPKGLEVDAAQRFSVVLQCNAASKVYRVNMRWED